MKRFYRHAKPIRGDRFQKAVDRMPVVMKELLQCPLLSRDDLSGIPKQGIYAFYEKQKPLYIGRSKKLRQRILEHGRPSSDRYSATFAFLIAMEKAKRCGITLEGKQTRELWERHEAFAALFASAKQRVGKMKLRVVEICDPIEQALFEVYAADHLGTLGRYNTFETH